MAITVTVKVVNSNGQTAELVTQQASDTKNFHRFNVTANANNINGSLYLPIVHNTSKAKAKAKK